MELENVLKTFENDSIEGGTEAKVRDEYLAEIRTPAFDYEAVYAASTTELRRLEELKKFLQSGLEDTERRIEGVTTTRQAIGPLVGEIPDTGGWLLEKVDEFLMEQETEFGIMANVRQILEAADHELTIPEIKEVLTEKGWEPGAYGNPLAVLHTTMKRLLASGEATEILSEDGKAYRHMSRKPQRRTQKAAKGASSSDSPKTKK